MCSQAGFHAKCRNGGGHGRPRSRPTSWCTTSPSHGVPSTTAGRVYCPSPPWLVGVPLSHSAQPQHRAQSLQAGEVRKMAGSREKGREGE